MRRILRKLHSGRGASILLALMFFLVCAMVAAVVIGSASTNARKSAGRREGEQTYYSVSSAARLLRDALEDTTFTAREYERIHHCNWAQNTQNLVGAPHGDERSVDALGAAEIAGGRGGAFADVLDQGAYQVFRGNAEFLENRVVFTGWTAAFTIEAEGCDPVEVEMAMGEDYGVTCTLRSRSAPERYGMVFTCPAASATQRATAEGYDACEQEVYVENEDGTTSTETAAFPVDLDTYTTTVTWGRGTITKER